MEAKINETQIPLRKVDIKNWNSAVAQQYNIQRLPTLWLYKDGKIVSQDSRDVLQRLNNI